MSNVEQSGPGGVTKRYGALGKGGVQGITTDSSGGFRAVYEFGVIEADAAETYKFTIPSSYAEITKVKVEVEEAFAAGTVDVYHSVDGAAAATILPAPMAITALGFTAGALAAPVTFAADPDSDEDYDELTVVIAGVTGTAGYAKVIVDFEKV